MSSSSRTGHADHGDASTSSDLSLYALLNVRPNASDEEIRRAYRQLVTTCHPDKAQDESLHADAAAAFHRIQEAYEILSDPVRRDIYDVYGLQGVRSGLELSVAGKSPEQFRKEWEASRGKRHQEEIDATLNYRGQYVFRIDATALISPYDPRLPRTPEVKTVSINSGLDVPIESSQHWGPLASDADTLHLGGFVYTRGDHGGGSFVAGYKRAYSDFSTVEFHGMAGLRTLLSAQTTVQLSPESTGTLATSWQPGRGVGLQILTNRQLGDATNGELSWVVGPREESGMALTLTHRPDEKTQISGRLDVGAATGITLRGARRVAENVTARAGFKLSPSTGIEWDIGASTRLNDVSTAGLSVVTSLKRGILLRARYSRAGHLFEFPIQLSTILDPKIFIAAHVLPPVALYLTNALIVQPLSKAISWTVAETERRRRSKEIEEVIREAEVTGQLLKPVAQRKMRKEGAQGLVVVLALYGEEAEVVETAKEKLSTAAAAAAAASPIEAGGGDDDDETTAINHPPPPSSPSLPLQPPPQEGEPPSAALPAAVIDVTIAVQYLCDNSRVVLHQGYSKSGLVGFCDPSPAASSKLLLVYYTYQGRPFMAKISDQEGVQLPGRGAPVIDPGEVNAVKILSDFLAST